MSKKRIVFTGGGTAGHVIVNIALIPIFLKKGWQVDYIGSKNGIEKDLVSQFEEVTYFSISTGKLRRYMSLENLKDPFKVLKGIYDAWKVLGRRRPNIIFSKGGFVSVPVLLAAKLRGIPTIIHESDYTPGLANKISAPFAKKILTTFPETNQYLPNKKTKYIGSVVRKELYEGDRKKGFDYTKLSESEQPVLLVMGGSHGSENINNLVRNNLDNLLKEFQIIHICGKGKIDKNIERKGYVQFEYIQEQLNDIFAITDFVLSRAGSNAIFEFLSLRIPMLLIPLSMKASRGDQILNAKSFHKQRFARVLFEEDLNEETFLHELQQLKEFGPIMVDYMKNYSSKNALNQVVEIIEKT